MYTAPVVQYTMDDQVLSATYQPVTPPSLSLSPQHFLPQAAPKKTEISSKKPPLLPLSGLLETLPSHHSPQPVTATQQVKQTAWHKLSTSLQQQPFTSLRSMRHGNAAIVISHAEERSKTDGRDEGLQTLYVNRPMLLADDL
jgi:hypothetical protein